MTHTFVCLCVYTSIHEYIHVHTTYTLKQLSSGSSDIGTQMFVLFWDVRPRRGLSSYQQPRFADWLSYKRFLESFGCLFMF